MKLNTDDTQQEQIINSMHRDTDIMLNCERCSRLYYSDLIIARRKMNKGCSLLCLRCRREDVQDE